MYNPVFMPEIVAQFPPADEVVPPLSRAHERLNADNTLCFETNDPGLILQARKLTAKVYLKLGFVQPEDIEDEVIKPSVDPYVAHSRYYVVTDPEKNDVLSTVRTIQYVPEKGEKSFPLFDHAGELDEDRLQELREYGIENLIEVSALARDDSYDEFKGTAALSLYKAIFFGAEKQQDSKSKEPVFVMACNPKIWKTFQLLFDGAIHRIGPDLSYPGQEAIPAALPIGDAPEIVIAESRNQKNPFRDVYERVVNYFLSGYDTNVLNDRALSALKSNGYEELVDKMQNGQWTEKELSVSLALKDITRGAIKGKFEQFARKFWPEIAANIVLLPYSAALSGVVAATIDPVAHTHWQDFFAISVGTQIPYLAASGDLVRGGMSEKYSKTRQAIATTVFATTFAAPYAYLVANGAAENPQSTVITVTVAGVGFYFLGKTIKKIRKAWQSRTGKGQSSGDYVPMIKQWDNVPGIEQGMIAVSVEQSTEEPEPDGYVSEHTPYSRQG